MRSGQFFLLLKNHSTLLHKVGWALVVWYTTKWKLGQNFLPGNFQTKQKLQNHVFLYFFLSLSTVFCACVQATRWPCKRPNTTWTNISRLSACQVSLYKTVYYTVYNIHIKQLTMSCLLYKKKLFSISIPMSRVKQIEFMSRVPSEKCL